MVKTLKNCVRLNDTYIEVVYLQKLKEIHAQKFEANTQMLSKYYIILHVYHIHNVFRVLISQEL